MLKIVTHPNKVLRQKSKAVLVKEIKDKDFAKLIKDMTEAMLAKDGIGLAGVQVGILKRIIIVNTKDGVLALINPKFTSKSLRKEIDEEACLSVPGKRGLVSRHKSLKVEALDINAKKIKFLAKGLFARVLQHEMDHLNGILFIDKAKKVWE